MRVGLIGAGRMGAGMARRWMRAGGHQVTVWNRSPEPAAELAAEGADIASQLSDFRSLGTPRVVWVSLPAGDVTRNMIRELAEVLEEGDVIVDAANSDFADSVVLAAEVEGRGIGWVDAGVSGGVWGLDNGYCVMAGARPDVWEKVRESAETLTEKGGCEHVGPPGAGHFVKMVHNGIEYAMLQAYAEGFELLKAGDEFDLNLHQVSALWRHGSVVQSWLLDLLERALRDDPDLKGITGYVNDSGEGRWTVREAVERGVPATAIAHSLFARFSSRDPDAYSMKVIAALRNQFGGHDVVKP